MIERAIYTPEPEQDFVEAYSWYEAREPGLGEDFLRCVEACLLTSNDIPRFIQSQWTSFAGRWSGDFQSRCCMTWREIELPFILTYIAHRIHRSGVRGLGNLGDPAVNEITAPDAATPRCLYPGSGGSGADDWRWAP